MGYRLPERPWNGLTVLDAFACQGGAAMGYWLAGFGVVCVDKDPQPRNPFPFVQADAVAYIAEHGAEFDFVHASPPCQLDSDCQRIMRNDHPDLIGPTHAAMLAAGRPGVIENVGGAREKLSALDGPEPVELCGAMFGLRTYRHRYFKQVGGLALPQLPHPVHSAPQAKMGRPVPEGWFYQAIGNFSGVETARSDMGVPWMNRDGIRECIPPAYSRWVGGHAAALLGAALER